MSDTQDKIGKILKTEEERDAIHIAVAPVIASHQMLPGARAGLLSNGQASTAAMPQIGIVDPFLTHLILPGERFWLFLFPNTVRSIRHHWEHETFDGAPENPYVEVSESERWLRQFAAMNRADYNNMITEAKTAGEVFFGDTSGPEYMYNNADEFWEHIENVTGKKFNSEHRSNTSFRCGC